MNSLGITARNEAMVLSHVECYIVKKKLHRISEITQFASS